MPRGGFSWTSPDVPTIDPFCESGEHDFCPHAMGNGVRKSLFGQAEEFRTLCRCECHRECPLTSVAVKDKRATIPKDAWPTHCICPAAHQASEWGL